MTKHAHNDGFIFQGRLVPTDLLIGGKTQPGSNKRIVVQNPATEEVICTVANGGITDGIAAIDAAEEAAPGWAATPPRARAEILRRCYEKLIEHADWLAALITLENGKALVDAKGEALYAAEFYRWYAEEAVRVIGSMSMAPSGTNRILVQHDPIGISVLVTPWNFPAAMATRKIAPALAAGCTCILKPAAETPLTAFAVADIMLSAGVPPGVLNVVTTDDPGPVVGALLHDRRVRKLSFTGSTRVGRLLLREAADQVISCSMELGGNAPFIVFDDANLDDAIEGAMIAKMRNGGEACTAANRFYVQRGIYDAFASKLAGRMSALKMGNAFGGGTNLGPMITPTAVQKISNLVEVAKHEGADVATGGEAWKEKGFFYPPTVLTGVSADAEILKDEIFGPVAALVPFDTTEEVIARSNDTQYGLAAYVYTSDLKKGLQVAGRLEYGMIGLNRGLVSDPAAPFGGVKQSGLGREGAHHGLLEFTETKYIATSW